MNSRNQVFVYSLLSVLAGLIFNSFSPHGIQFLAEPKKEVLSIDEALTLFADPQIRNINLDMAVELHDQGVLFVDARAEEYLVDGIIPGAIANDDIDVLATRIDSLIGFDTGFVVYCNDDDCGFSKELAYDLQDMEFSNIFVFKGGWKAWMEAKMEIGAYE